MRTTCKEIVRLHGQRGRGAGVGEGEKRQADEIEGEATRTPQMRALHGQVQVVAVGLPVRVQGAPDKVREQQQFTPATIAAPTLTNEPRDSATAARAARCITVCMVGTRQLLLVNAELSLA